MHNPQIYLGVGDETIKQPHRGCPTLVCSWETLTEFRLFALFTFPQINLGVMHRELLQSSCFEKTYLIIINTE
jgi:hypothetical protein